MDIGKEGKPGRIEPLEHPTEEPVVPFEPTEPLPAEEPSKPTRKAPEREREKVG